MYCCECFRERVRGSNLAVRLLCVLLTFLRKSRDFPADFGLGHLCRRATISTSPLSPGRFWVWCLSLSVNFYFYYIYIYVYLSLSPSLLQICFSNETFSLTAGSFLLTAEFYCLQLCSGEISCIHLELFHLQMKHFYLQSRLSCLQRESVPNKHLNGLTVRL